MFAVALSTLNSRRGVAGATITTNLQVQTMLLRKRLLKGVSYGQ